MTVMQLIRAGSSMLAEAGVPGAEHDALELYLHLSGRTLSQYAASLSEEIEEAEEKTYFSLIKRRAGREPLQYITALAPFYGREFYVRPGVLIPRFDTETLVECVLPRLKSGMRLLDLCTGSGCILLTLLLEGPEGLEGCGSDLSEEALSCAEENAARLQVPAVFVKSDLFGRITGRYDIITANPPYIRSGEIGLLDPEVRDYEPRLALDGSGDGLAFYRRICAEAGRFLKEGGTLAFETGADETEAVRELMQENGFSETEIHRDLSGLGRVVIGVRYGNI